MSVVEFNLVGEYSRSRANVYNIQDLINFYVAQDTDSTIKNYLAPTPGIESYITVDLAINKVGRPNNCYAYDGNLYFVLGDTAYQLDDNDNIIQLGNITLSTSQGALSWANNNTQIALSDGAYLYIYTITTNNFQKVTLPTGIPANPFVVYYQDARLFFRCRNDPRVFYSDDQGDMSDISANNEIIQESRPCNATGLIGANERLMLLGDVSTEIWEPPTSPTNVPILRDNNLLYEFGTIASASVIKGILEMDKGKPVISFVAWLATNPNGNGVFVLSYGGNPIKISNRAIDIELEDARDIDDCYGIVYKVADAIILQWTLPSLNKTYCFELLTQSWFRAVMNNGDASVITGHAFVNRKHFISTNLDNKLYQFNPNTMTDDMQLLVSDTNNVYRSRTTQTFFDKSGREICGNKFTLYFESGYFDSGQAPLIYLSCSIDNGSTFSRAEPGQMGEIGEYGRQLNWFSFGTGTSFTFKIDSYEGVRVFLMRAIFDYQVATS